jgi:Spy/CpxP family protein refolding chaperone
VRKDVDMYHVDTPRGLDALMKMLKERDEKLREARGW